MRKCSPRSRSITHGAGRNKKRAGRDRRVALRGCWECTHYALIGLRRQGHTGTVCTGLPGSPPTCIAHHFLPPYGPQESDGQEGRSNQGGPTCRPRCSTSGRLAQSPQARCPNGGPSGPPFLCAATAPKVLRSNPNVLFRFAFLGQRLVPIIKRLWRHGRYPRCRPLCFPSDGKKTHRVCPKFLADVGDGRAAGRPYKLVSSPSGGFDCYVAVFEWFGTDPTRCYIILFRHGRLTF
jgi:hypothetical protein